MYVFIVGLTTRPRGGGDSKYQLANQNRGLQKKKKIPIF